MSHALLAPSSAATWLRCPGSVILRATGGIETGTPEAAEGQAAHELAEFAAQLYRSPANRPSIGVLVDAMVGGTAKNGEIFTEEMVRGARLYVDVLEANGAFTSGSSLELEEHLDIPRIHDECNGTPDANWCMYPDGSGRIGSIHVADYKYGHGIVEAFECWQLICYASGVMSKFEIDGHEDQALDVHLTIVQPRSYGADGQVRTWSVKGSDLRPYVNQLRAAAETAMGPDVKCVSGPQCRHCLGRPACEASRIATAQAISVINTATPTPLSDESLGEELPILINALKAIEYRRDALLEEAESRMATGKNIPGLIRKPIKGQRRWGQSLATVDGLGKTLGTSLIADPKLVTPAEAERRIAKLAGMTVKKAKSLVGPMVDRPRTGFKIVPDDGFAARKTFSK